MSRLSRAPFWSRSLLASVLTFGVIGAPLVLSTTVAVAESASATDFMKAKHQTLIKLIKEKAPDPKIEAELKALLDYEEMAKGALGANAEKRTDAERKEFTDLLRRSIEKTYKKRLNDTLHYEVVYKAEQPKENGDVVVKTEAKNNADKREAPSQIDYVLRKKGATFMVIDVVTEGSSTVTTWRKETDKSIKKNGWDGLIKKMKENLAKP